MTYIKTLKKSFFYSALALSTALTLTMAQPAFANTMPEMSPGQIARDVEVQYNSQTGQREYIAPTFDPFEEDPELAASVSLRSVSDQVSIEGETIRGGAILDMAFYYSSASNDPYDVRGFDDAVFVSGEYAPTILRDNRILECSENVRETVYHHESYYSPSIYFNFYRPYRHYSGFYGYNHRHRSPWLRRLYWDYYGGDGWTRRRGWRDRDGVHRRRRGPGDDGVSRRRRPHDDDGTTRRRRPDRDDDGTTRRRRPDRDGSGVTRPRRVVGDDGNVTRRPRRDDSGTTVRRPRRDDNGTTVRRPRRDDNGTTVRRPRRDDNGTTVRRPRRDDSETTVRRRRDIVPTSTGRTRTRDIDRRESRTTTPVRRRGTETRETSRKKKPNVYRRPSNPDAVRSERRETRRATRNAPERRRAQPTTTRRATPQPAPQRPRTRTAPKPKPAPAVVSRRRASPPAVSRPKPASKPAPRRSVNKAASKAYKSKSDNGRSRARGRRNFHPEYYDGSRQVVSSSNVNCAREERLSLHIPQDRLDAARFDGLTMLVLDRYGAEIPVFIPPNYIEGFRQATGDRSYIAPSSGYSAPREPVYSTPTPAPDPYRGSDPRQPRIYGDPGSVPTQSGYPQPGQ